MTSAVQEMFSLEGRTAIVTGATGVLGGAMARGLARAGAKVGILGRRGERAKEVAQEIEDAGGTAIPLAADVLDRARLEEVRDEILERWGRLDILVNAAGGNIPEATATEEQTIFDLPTEAFGKVLDLNLIGTLLPSQVFGEAMANEEAGGCIVNISSMAVERAITRTAGYGAAKAAVDNLTRWLAVDLCHRYGDGMRVNAIAPGFFLGEQNRKLLTNEDGSLTERGQKIVTNTPAGRFGEPDELVGALVWLCGPGAAFVNGAIIPVDGAFSAYSGV